MKKIFMLMFAMLWLFTFSFNCSAHSDSENQLHNVKDDLFSILSDDVKQALEDMGVDEENFEK